MTDYELFLALKKKLDGELDALFYLVTGLTAVDPSNWMVGQINRRLRGILERTKDAVDFVPKKGKGGSG
ncbi:hypothetical protein [Lacticaseibacillus paracasei]|uniref:hypothetical protein n=1 Tax=Lacticaseibacillus paracasei TaxID=1597 RepID=UPI0007BF2278|nr:hypothetical protein [Lacticaseibacillus paracasei]URW92687.1 hypothetical protein NCY29_06825 [Lacticaseibacillus paracasei]